MAQTKSKVVIVLWGIVFAHTVTAQSLSVSPLFFSIDLRDTPYASEVRIENTSNQDQTFSLKKVHLTRIDNAFEIIDDQQLVAKKNLVVSSLSLKESTITVSQGEYRDVEFSIKPHALLSAGSHYVGIVVSPLDSQSFQSIVIPLFVRVKGDSSWDIEILSHQLHDSFVASKDNTLSILLSNTGNTHTEIDGWIQVSSSRGSWEKRYPLFDDTGERFLFPKERKMLKRVIGEKSGFVDMDIIHVTTHITSRDGTYEQSLQNMFFVTPWREIVVFGGIAITVIIFVGIFIQAHKKILVQVIDLVSKKVIRSGFVIKTKLRTLFTSRGK